MFYLCGILALFSVAAVYVHLRALHEMRHMPDLQDVDAPSPTAWPSLSVVVTACNEAATIDTAVRSLLAVDYPNLEVIAVNDRSTDETGDILDAVAETHPKLQVVHNKELPAGWLGKVHAMHLGMEASAGEFVLFCDADVHFKPESLRCAMAWVVNESLDHLSLVPKLVGNSMITLALIQMIGGAWMLSTRPSLVNRDKPGGYGGCGAFNLVRRSAYEKTEGWSWLRMEIADDVGLGYLMVRHGFRSRLGLASTLLEIEWYANLAEVMAGMEKNAFAVIGRFSVLRALACILAATALNLSPWVLLFTPWAWVGFSALFALVLIPIFYPHKPFSWLHSVLSTQVGVLLAWTMMRSMVKARRQGAVDWRGTRYDIVELHDQQRVKL